MGITPDMVTVVLFVLSVEAESFLDLLESTDQTSFTLVLNDLELLDAMGRAGVPIPTMIGQWAYLMGPTGRVSYWVAPDDGDRWLIESIDVT